MAAQSPAVKARKVLCSFQTSLTRALGKIDRASDIVEFSTVVFTHDKQMRRPFGVPAKGDG